MIENGKEPQLVLSEFDDELYEDYYPFEKERKLLEILTDAQEKGNEKISQQMRWELDLLNKTCTLRPDVDIPDRWKWCEDNIFKSLPFWEKEAVPYFRMRTKSCLNKLHLARYHYFLWVFERRIDDISMSASLFLEIGNRYVESKWFSRALGPTPFLFRFALRIWKSLKMKEELRKGLQATLSAITAEFKDGDRRWLLELVKALSTYAHYLEKGQKAQLTEIVNKCIVHYEGKENYHLAEMLLKELANLYRNLKKETQRKEALRRVAELLELEAERASDSNLLRVGFLVDAMTTYAEIGDRKKKDQLKEAISEIDMTKELKEIRTEFKLDFKGFDEYVQNLVAAQEGDVILYVIGKDGFYVPSLESARRRVEHLKKDYPLRSLLSHAVVDEYGNRIEISGEESIKELMVKEQLMLDGQMSQTYLSRLLDKMIDNKKLDAEVFKQFMSNCHFPHGTVEIFEEAYLDYCDKRFASAISLMVPQIEGLIRVIYQQCNIPILSIRKLGLQTTMLNALLSHPEASSILGEDFTFYLKCLLVDPTSMNIRNVVCHGNLDFKGYSRTLADLVFFIIVRLGVVLHDRTAAGNVEEPNDNRPTADE